MSSLELETCCQHKFSSITNHSCIDLHELSATTTETQATLPQPSQGQILFPWNSMILFIMTLILAHPFGTKTFQAYLTNLSSSSPCHTSKIFLPKSIWNELTDKVKKLIIAHNKNVASFSPSSPATLSP